MKRYYYAFTATYKGKGKFIGECVAENIQQVLEMPNRNYQLTSIEQLHEAGSHEPIGIKKLSDNLLGGDADV